MHRHVRRPSHTGLAVQRAACTGTALQLRTEQRSISPSTPPLLLLSFFFRLPKGVQSTHEAIVHVVLRASHAPMAS